jgi:signal transduction histidine kinase
MLTMMVAQKTQEIEERGKELEIMNKNLVQVNEELDIFLYRSSHDLISPVKSIKGLLGLMKLSKDDQATYVELMEDRINRLERILNEINSYVKNAKRELVITQFNFRELITEIWSEIEFIENAAAIDLQIDVEEDFMLALDRDRWKMVLSNLMANAVKYHDYRKPKPFIRISVKEGNGYQFNIEDNGQGIKKEYQSRLFEMFYRANEGSNGTGLGLFLVKKVIDSLQGTIEITSTLGVGTRVEITLPRPAGLEREQPVMDTAATGG